MEQLAATPVTRAEVVLGKLLPYLAHRPRPTSWSARCSGCCSSTCRSAAARLLLDGPLLLLPDRRARARHLHLGGGEIAGARHAGRHDRHLPAGLPALRLHVRHRGHAAGAPGGDAGWSRRATSWSSPAASSSRGSGIEVLFVQALLMVAFAAAGALARVLRSEGAGMNCPRAGLSRWCARSCARSSATRG